jgi:hypothetical protein
VPDLRSPSGHPVADPALREAVESFADGLDPADATIWRRTLLWGWSDAWIATELGADPGVMRRRRLVLFRRIRAAILAVDGS